MMGVILLLATFITIVFFIKVVPLEQVDQLSSSIVDYYLMLAVVLFVIATVAAIVFPIISVISNPKGSVKGLISAVFIVVIILISYSVSSDELLKLSANYAGPDNTPLRLKLTDAGLYTTYIIFGLTVIAAIYSEVVKIFK